jgi:regulator of RNase E activity RraA
MWSRGFSAAAPSLEIQPWMFNVPLQVGDICVYPEDIVCVDEGERSIVVIPKEKLQEVMAKLPILKTASDAVLADIENGSPLLDSTRRHPDFYSNSK